MKNLVLSFLFLLCLPTVFAAELSTPKITYNNIPFSISLPSQDEAYTLIIDGQTQSISEANSFKHSWSGLGKHSIELLSESGNSKKTLWCLPGMASLLPAILAIAVGFLSKQVLLSLFAGIWLAATFLGDLHPLRSFFTVFDTYILSALADSDHASIILFSMLLGAVTCLIERNGGTQGIVNFFTRFANSAKRTELVTWLMGLCIFFDDYANTLIVGKTMRPLTDKFGISREKLAFIVDATAAPVASIALISTWISTEIGLIDQGLKSIGLETKAYEMFLYSIPYRFYPILMLIFVFMVIMLQKDMFSMAKTQARTAQAATKSINNDIDGKLSRAALPWLTLIFGTLVGLWITGAQENAPLSMDYIRDVFGNANAYTALIWASSFSMLIAFLQSLKPLGMRKTFEAIGEGFKSMTMACAVLVLAWGLGAAMKDLQVSQYLIEIFSGVLSPKMMPAITFILAALCSFATGTSWGTMAILMPITIPLAYSLGVDAGLANETCMVILTSSIASVLAGSVFGDHCSPISDTTVLSCIGSDCELLAHVKTQLPYALLVGAVGITLGDIGSAYGLPVWLGLILGTAVLFAVLHFFGHRRAEG